MKWWMWPIVGAAVVIAAVFALAPNCHADPPPVHMCDYLDEHPTIAGMDDVANMLLYGNGLPPQQAAQFIITEITQHCPRHMLTLQMAVAYYRDAHYKQAI